jgi:eukaryotic-like serine/threonine-protein kinase
VEHFSLAGYDVQELLGFGATGEVWRAVEQSSGELVALKRLHGAFEAIESTGAQSAAGVELRREAALLASVRHEHIVRLRSVVPTSSGLVLVLDYAEGGSLATLLTARGRLSAGEVVTVGAPLAQALADVHARGLLHGDVTPANIVFTAAGKPLLADLGIASLSGERTAVRGGTTGFADAAVSSAADVYGLGATCFALLAGRSPGNSDEPRAQSLATLAPAAPEALVEAIESALVVDPSSRPSAADFGRAMFASCAPEPVRLVAMPAADVRATTAPAMTHRVSPVARPVEAAVKAAESRAARRRGRRRPLRRASSRDALKRSRLLHRFAVVGLGVGLVVAAIAGGVVWATHGSRAVAGELPQIGSAPATVSNPDPDWSAVLTTLDRQRDQAFADADASALETVYTADSPALAADRRTLAALVAAGEHAQGLALRLVSVTPSSRGAGQVSVLVADVLPAYDIVGPTGAATRIDGRGQRSWLVVLRSTTAPGGWRIASLTPAPM